MRIIVILVSILVLLVGVAAAAGALLPKMRYASTEETIAAPRTLIIGVIRDVTRQPEWRSGVNSVELLADGRFVETTARGDTITFSWADDPDADLALRFTSTSGYEGKWTARLHEEPGATRVTVTERIFVRGIFTRLISYLFFDQAEFSRRYLAELRARAETIE